MALIPGQGHGTSSGQWNVAEVRFATGRPGPWTLPRHPLLVGWLGAEGPEEDLKGSKAWKTARVSRPAEPKLSKKEPDP